jgi:Mce-associated membrane protein
MTDDQDPRYDEATELDEPAEPWADQPALFEEPTATPHDIEQVAEPEGSWEPEDEPAWETDVVVDPEPDLVEAWEEPAEDSGEEPAPDPEPELQHHPDVPHDAADEAPVLLAALAYQEVDDRDVLLDPVGEDYADELAEADYAEEPEHAEAVPVAGRSGGPMVAILSVLVAALLLAGGWLGYLVADNRGQEPVEASRAEALKAGRDAARLVFSYDYRRLDKDFAAASAVTFGKFKTDYESTTKKLVGDVAPRYKAVLLAEVSEAGVITASSNQVQLLVFLDVQSTSTLAATPKVTPRRLKMTMQRVDDRWLVSAVDAF